MAFTDMLECLEGIDNSLDRASTLADMLVDLYRNDIQCNEMKTEGDIFASSSMHFLKCCLERALVDVPLVTSLLQNQDEDYTLHTSYMKNVYVYITMAYE